MTPVRVARNQLCPTPGHCETEPYVDLRCSADDLERLRRHMDEARVKPSFRPNPEDWDLYQAVVEAQRWLAGAAVADRDDQAVQ